MIWRLVELAMWHADLFGDQNLWVFESSGTSKRIAETNVAMKLLAYIKQNNV